MERQDVNKILLKDTKIYNYEYKFHNHLNKYNIETLGQLFDDDLMAEIMKNCSRATRTELNGYISLMKYEYLKVPLIYDYFLDRKAKSIKTYTIETHSFDLDYFYFNVVDFSQMGFNSKKHLKELLGFASQIKEQMPDLKLIDFFRKLIENKFGSDNVRKIAGLYVEYYDNKMFLQKKEDEVESKQDNLEANDAITILKDELEKLIVIRDTLDNQISTLREKIELLFNEQTKGGARI